MKTTLTACLLFMSMLCYGYIGTIENFDNHLDSDAPAWVSEGVNDSSPSSSYGDSDPAEMLPVEQGCDVFNTINGTGDEDVAVWLFSGPYADRYVFEDSGTFTQFDDGTAQLTGTVTGSESGDILELAVNFENRSTWAEWSAMGRSYKDSPGLVGDNYLDYSYYELSSSSTLTVNGGEDVLILSHAPANFYYAFQLGIGANTYTAAPGLGGWFTYIGAAGSGQGDFMMEGNCPYVDPGFDCTDLSANIGDTCNDLDSNTENDIVGDDCICAGTLVEVLGCTDSASSNYNPAANIDDGSCLYLCDTDPAELLTVSNSTGFDDGSGNSYGSPSGMGLLAGANNVFGGFIWDVATTGQSISDFCINIDYTVTGDPADFPKILEFRIENNGTGNWHAFNTEVPGPGTYNLGGLVSSGAVNGSGFDPDGVTPAIVAAVAHFSGAALVGDMDVVFSNLCVSTDCGVDISGCTDPAADNYNQAATVDDGSCTYGGGCDVAVDFEATGSGADYTWTVFENDDNPPVNIVANPDMSGINTSATVAEITARANGNPWAGAETMHGSDIGTFTLTPANSLIKLMVYKTTISDVGIKLVAADGGALGEIKVANTLVNQWEELVFDFTSQEAGMPGAVSPYDQIVIFPDFTFDGRPQDNVVYFDNFTFCPQLLTISGPPQAIVACGIGSIDPSETGMATASGECVDITVQYSDGLLMGNCPWTLSRTWTATDACGAIASCVQEILIMEADAPVDCPPTDLNGDLLVDVYDLLDFNSMFGSSCIDCPEDFNDDGVVDISDFLIFNTSYGADCTALSAGDNNQTLGLNTTMMDDVRESGIENIHPELLKVIIEMSTSIDFTISPNPNNGNQFLLELQGHIGKVSSATIDIMDMTGRRVLSRSLSQVGPTIFVESDSHLSPGLYLISLTMQGTVATHRMVVE